MWGKQSEEAARTEIKKKSARLLDVRDVFILGGYVVWESVNVICIARAKDPVTNQAPYSSATVVLVAECLKFTISMRQLWKAGLSTADIDWQNNCNFSVPALLYCMNNNLFIFALRLVPGSIFQMLLNLRSLYTGILFYFLGRQISGRQWSSLVLLCFGTVLCQYVNMEDTGSMIVSQWGVTLSIIYGFISVAAGVWTELLLKKGAKSIHLDNAQLYFYGIWFNLGGVLMLEWGTEAEGGGGKTPAGVFRGWELASTWTICFNIAATGLIVSAIFKYYDNIVKIFSVTVSNFVVYFYNVMIEKDLPFTYSFLLGLSLVAIAMIHYNTEGTKKGEETKGGDGWGTDTKKIDREQGRRLEPLSSS